MNVSRAHRVAVEHLENDTGRSVGGEGVGGRDEAVEVVIAICVAAEFATEVVVALVLRVLEIVLSIGRCLP